MIRVRFAASFTFLLIAFQLFAQTPAPEFDGLCAMHLLQGDLRWTSCEIRWTNEQNGKTYCFLNRDSRTDFLKNYERNEMLASEQYRTIILFHQPDVVVDPAPSAFEPFAIPLNTLFMNEFANRNTRLFKLKVSNGAAKKVAQTSVPQMTDIAFKKTTLFAVTFTDLLKVNLANGKSTLIGHLGSTKINGLAVNKKTGKLYAAGFDGIFMLINQTSGRGAVIGNFGSGLTCSGDLAFNAKGKLFASVKQNGKGSDFLARIALTTGKATIIGPIGFRDVFGLSFRNGILFGVTAFGEFLKIDLTTGAGKLVGRNAFPQAGMTTSPK